MKIRLWSENSLVKRIYTSIFFLRGGKVTNLLPLFATVPLVLRQA